MRWSLWMVSSFALMSILGMAALIGCGGDSPATYQNGTGADPLDGGVIANDGNQYTLGLDPNDPTFIKTVAGQDGLQLGFDRVGDQIVPTMVVTHGGAHELDYDPESGYVTARISNALIGEQTMSFEVGDFMNYFGATSARAVKQEGTDCEQAVDAMDVLAALIVANAAEAEEMIVSLANQMIDEQGLEPADMIKGVAADVIHQFIQALLDFCQAWIELRTTIGIDPCNYIPA